VSGAPRRRARRRFLGLLAAGAAATIASPASLARAATTPPTRRRRPAAPSPAPTPAARLGRRSALPAEIEKQKRWVADALAAIRRAPLPPGSDPAFTFRPMPARRRRGG
jgi:hypothetical protein